MSAVLRQKPGKIDPASGMEGPPELEVALDVASLNVASEAGFDPFELAQFPQTVSQGPDNGTSNLQLGSTANPVDQFRSPGTSLQLVMDADLGSNPTLAFNSPEAAREATSAALGHLLSHGDTLTQLTVAMAAVVSQYGLTDPTGAPVDPKEMGSAMAEAIFRGNDVYRSVPTEAKVVELSGLNGAAPKSWEAIGLQDPKIEVSTGPDSSRSWRDIALDEARELVISGRRR